MNIKNDASTNMPHATEIRTLALIPKKAGFLSNNFLEVGWGF
jgi:hypothetical protein